MGRVKHVVCAISGGVDSAIAAYLLKKEDHKVTGCFMRNWNMQDESLSSCSTDRDQKDAEYVCDKLRIPFISVDFSKDYWNLVFRYMIRLIYFNVYFNKDIKDHKSAS